MGVFNDPAPTAQREERNVTLGEAQLVLAGLAGLREAGRQSAVVALIAIRHATGSTWIGRSGGY